MKRACLQYDIVPFSVICIITMNSYHVSETNTDLKISSEVQQSKIVGKKKHLVYQR